MKVIFLIATLVGVAALPSLASCTWFGGAKSQPSNITGARTLHTETIPHHHEDKIHHNNIATVTSSTSSGPLFDRPIREHVQEGPDTVTVSTEVPIQTRIVEVPVIHTATVTATVTAVETAVETVTKTLTEVETMHATHTVMPIVDTYRLKRDEAPKTVPVHEKLVERRVTDIKHQRLVKDNEVNVADHADGIVKDEKVTRITTERRDHVHHNGGVPVTQGGGLLAGAVALFMSALLF